MKKNHAISIETVEKWIRKNEKTLQTTSWLKYDKGRGGTVLSLKCKLCILGIKRRWKVAKFTAQLLSSAQRTFIRQLSKITQDQRCIRRCVVYKEQGCVSSQLCSNSEGSGEDGCQCCIEYQAEIQNSLLYCKQRLPFTEMGPICSLEEKDRVNLGSGYKNDKACTVIGLCTAFDQI